MKNPIKYNSPLILNYTVICFVVIVISISLGNDDGHLNKLQFYFSAGGTQFSWANPIEYFRLFSHVAGHMDFDHFLRNFMLILILGPLLEEKYGGKLLLFMILATAVSTGIVQTIFFKELVLGASGIAFMLIILSSLSNFKTGEIPLTFILVTIVYIGGEILRAINHPDDQTSQFAHIMGGICGGIFGYLEGRKDVPK